MKSIVESPYCTTWIENDILLHVYKPNLIIDLGIAKKLVAHRLEVTAGVTRPVLVDICNMIAIDADARKYLAGPQAIKHVSAGAIYLNSYLQFLAGTVYLKIDTPLVPSRLFTEKAKALLWLEQFKHFN